MNVALRQTVRVQFDRFLRGDTTSWQTICIQAGPTSPCLGSSMEYDPVDRVLVAKLTGDLMPNTRYTVRVLAPTTQQPTQGVRAFDDVPLAAETSFAFTSGTTASTPTLAEPMRTVTFCGVAPAPSGVFGGCGNLANCHAPGTAVGTPAVGNALQLSAGTMGKGVPAAVADLVATSRVANETATAPDPTEPRRGPNSAFGQNMPFIDKSNPANSYLVYKLLVAGADGFAADAAPCVFDPAEPALAGLTCTADSGGVEPWVPAGAGKRAVLGEHDRLFGRLAGNGMPGAGLSGLRTISAWIAAGAATPTADCPAAP